MAELVIGHTTDRSSKVWVRGDGKQRRARVRLKGADGQVVESEVLELAPEHGWTAVARFRGLSADTTYRVTARFARRARRLESGTRREGRLKTFPSAGAEAPLCFLLGSCNFAPARLTALRERLAAYLGHSALERSLARDFDTWYWPARYLRPAMRKLWPLASKLLLGTVDRATRYQLPEPGCGDPFGRLREQLGEPEQPPPAFALHVGDQIYFDVDFPGREPRLEEYRRAYQQAWFEDAELREFLAEYPQYMILDDHDAAGPPKGGVSSPPHETGLRVYREYVHSRNPTTADGALYYDFEYGGVQFFVLDARSERIPAQSRMVSAAQRDALFSWLARPGAALKVVISSIPFLTQVRDSGEREDKWCGDDYRAQRDQILDHIFDNRIERLVFLCGDMHCTYHTTLAMGTSERRLVLHELAGGPFNQVEYGRRDKFHEHYRGVTRGGHRFATAFSAFSGAAPSVLRVKVATGGEVDWEEIRLSRASDEGHYEPPRQCGRVRWPKPNTTTTRS